MKLDRRVRPVRPVKRERLVLKDRLDQLDRKDLRVILEQPGQLVRRDKLVQSDHKDRKVIPVRKEL